MNQVIVMGRLVRDPDVKTMEKDPTVSYARFCLAVDRNYKDGGTDFIECIAWRRQAEFAEKYLCKGKKILLTGSLQVDNYTTKDGSKRRTYQVYTNHIEFVESRSVEETNNAFKSGKLKKDDDDFMAIPDDISDDELPFK